MRLFLTFHTYQLPNLSLTSLSLFSELSVTEFRANLWETYGISVQTYGIPAQLPDTPGCKESTNVSLIFRRVNFVVFSERAFNFFYVIREGRKQINSCSLCRKLLVFKILMKILKSDRKTKIQKISPQQKGYLATVAYNLRHL